MAANPWESFHLIEGAKTSGEMKAYNYERIIYIYERILFSLSIKLILSFINNKMLA
jgi:hypothetical protein